jgi:hypothetical protein
MNLIHDIWDVIFSKITITELFVLQFVNKEFNNFVENYENIKFDSEYVCYYGYDNILQWAHTNKFKITHKAANGAAESGNTNIMWFLIMNNYKITGDAISIAKEHNQKEITKILNKIIIEEVHISTKQKCKNMIKHELDMYIHEKNYDKILNNYSPHISFPYVHDDNIKYLFKYIIKYKKYYGWLFLHEHYNCLYPKQIYKMLVSVITKIDANEIMNSKYLVDMLLFIINDIDRISLIYAIIDEKAYELFKITHSQICCNSEIEVWELLKTNYSSKKLKIIDSYFSVNYNDVWRYAWKYSNVNTLRYFFKHNKYIPKMCVSLSAASGNYEAVKWFLKKGCKLELSPAIIYGIIQKFDVDLFKLCIGSMSERHIESLIIRRKYIPELFDMLALSKINIQITTDILKIIGNINNYNELTIEYILDNSTKISYYQLIHENMYEFLNIMLKKNNVTELTTKDIKEIIRILPVQLSDIYYINKIISEFNNREEMLNYISLLSDDHATLVKIIVHKEKNWKKLNISFSVLKELHCIQDINTVISILQHYFTINDPRKLSLQQKNELNDIFNSPLINMFLCGLLCHIFTEKKQTQSQIYYKIFAYKKNKFIENILSIDIFGSDIPSKFDEMFDEY